MRFFERSKRLHLVLKIINILIAIRVGYIFVFNLVLWKEWELLRQPEFWHSFLLWMILLLITFALRCIIKDAEEDLYALKGMIENNKSE